MKFLILLLMAFSLAETANFIMSDQADIYTTKDETLNLEAFTKTGSSNHIALDFHFKRKLIFFTNPESQAIIRYNIMDKTQPSCNVSGEPTALATDWLKGKVYYVVNNKDMNNSTIYETNLDCSGTSIFMTLTSTLIKDLVLDPLAGYLFWINEFKEPKIERYSLNGEGRYTIMSGLVLPNALALDLSSRRLHVTEGKNNYDGKNKVVGLSYEGHDVKNFYIPGSYHLKGLTCVDGTLYVCDPGSESIWHNHPGNPDKFIRKPLNNTVYLIKHFSDRMQPVGTPVSSGCDSGCAGGIVAGILLSILCVICVLYWKYRQHMCKFYRTVKGQPNHVIFYVSDI